MELVRLTCYCRILEGVCIVRALIVYPCSRLGATRSEYQIRTQTLCIDRQQAADGVYDSHVIRQDYVFYFSEYRNAATSVNARRKEWTKKIQARCVNPFPCPMARSLRNKSHHGTVRERPRNIQGRGRPAWWFGLGLDGYGMYVQLKFGLARHIRIPLLHGRRSWRWVLRICSMDVQYTIAARCHLSGKSQRNSLPCYKYTNP